MVLVKVSALELLIAVALVSTNFSNAFVPSNLVNRNELQRNGFSTRDNVYNGLETSLSASAAPLRSGSGLDVIDSWKLLPDGRIKGVMAGSGDSVLTSPLKNKNGLKEASTVRTVSGSRYKLGKPASVLPANRLGVARKTLGVRGTQPLKNNPMTSQQGFMQNFLDNKGRATMPVESSASQSSGLGSELLTPLVGGASAIAIGAAIGTGVISEKGVDLNKMPKVDAGEVMKSVKSLDLPDIKSLKAPTIPSGGISLPKFDQLPSVSAPKLPDLSVQLPNINLPGASDLKLPDVPSVSIPGAVKGLGNTAKAVGNAFENSGIELPSSPFAKKKPQITTYGRGPYEVPMPYLDRQVVEAENQRRAEAEAARAQKMQQEAEAQVLQRQSMQREQELQEQARIKQEADARVKKAEDEAARLRAEVEQARLAAIKTEKAASVETARLRMEAEAALLKEQAAKEEFTQKLQAAELAKLRESSDYSTKLAEAEAAAAKGRILEEDTIVKQRLAAQAMSRQAVASAEIKEASIGAAAARKAGYSSPSMSTYQAWQDRQRVAYETRAATTPDVKAEAGAVQSSTFVAKDNLSTYQKWQQSVRANQVVSASTEPVKAAYITGAPAPVASQLVSGTTSLSEVAIALNGDLGYVVAGSAAVLAGLTYTYENQKIQDELTQMEKLQEAALKTVAPPSTPTPPAKPAPLVAPPKPVVREQEEVPTSVTMAIDANYAESASVTKAVSPPPPVTITTPSPVNELPEQQETVAVMDDASYNPPSMEAPQIEEQYEEPSVDDFIASNAVTNGASYLESMSGSGDGLKASYSPFSNTKGAVTNDSLYNPPSMEAPQIEEQYEEPSVDDFIASNAVTNGASYLESMSGSGDGLKASYSPFGTSKISTNDSLYAPPAMAASDVTPAAVPEVSTSSNDGDSYTDTFSSTSFETDVASNQGSYLNALSGSSESTLKKSYSPFGRKPEAVNDNGPYSSDLSSESFPFSEAVSETNDLAHLDEEYNTSAPNYLIGLNDSAGIASTGGKRSYSPFGSNKPKGSESGSNSLYQPPVESSAFLDEVIPQQSSSLAHDRLPTEEERDKTPVSSYLERLVIPLGDASNFVKKSFSPFGDGGKSLKGQASDSNSLYQPPDESSSVISDVLPSDEERDSIPVSSYLERLVIPLDFGGKRSFSPFGDGGKSLKGQASDSNSLYQPPAESLVVSDELPSDEERDSTPVSNYLERLVISLDDTSTDGKRSFSPFGDGGKSLKGRASDSNSLYQPPTEPLVVSDQLPSDEERDGTPVSNYLEKLVIPLSGSSNFLKKSFSPFGDGGKSLKGQASGSDSLYDPPGKQSTLSNELPSDEERDSTPVSNYLEKLVIPLSGASNFLKKSFSPFGNGGKTLQGQRSGSDILYKPPVESSRVFEEQESDVSNLDGGALSTAGISASAEHTVPLMDEPESPNPLPNEFDIIQEDVYVESEEAGTLNQGEIDQGENSGSTYLNSISDFEKPLKSSYSPFGFSESDKFESSISDLYTAAELQGSEPSGVENTDFTTESIRGPSVDDGYTNYLESLGGAVTDVKKSFSPFGSYSESNFSDGSTDMLYDSP